MKHPRKKSEEGVALITVLMIVAAMSAVAVALSAAVMSATTRARTVDAASQADWLALASEEVGRALIEEMFTASEGRLSVDMPGFAEPVRFPIEGGEITMRASDGGNCFNVNRLRITPVREDENAVGVSGPNAAEDFESLLKLAEVGDQNLTGLVYSAADWIDADQSPGLNGAENAYYASSGLQYRTPGLPMIDASELRAVRYYTPDVMDALGPLVCALPESGEQTLNINTLTAAQAPLLSLAFSGALSVEAARDLIFQRPVGGWPDVETFLTEPAIRQISPDLRRSKLLSVLTEYVRVQAAIDFANRRRTVEIMYRRNGAQRIETVWRERKG